MKTVRLGYISNDGATQIRALMWQPDSVKVAPRGIIQIVHGMAEHIERYAEFAEYLVGLGYVVCAEDHVGHGKSVGSAEDLGHIPLDGGADILVEDVHALRQLVASRFSSVTPYVMFGHSMGSFIVRVYITRHGQGLSAAVLCGTGQQAPMLSWLGNKVARLIASSKGESYRSTFVDNLGAGGFGKKIADARTPLDWLSTDPAVVDAYIADPECGQMFSVGAYAALTSLTSEAVKPASASLVPRDLPLLFIAGSQDPVGECGKGVQAAVQQYRQAGVRTVDCVLYEGMRHEILNEPDRVRVFEETARWIGSQTGSNAE